MADEAYRDFIAPLQKEVGGLVTGQAVLFKRTDDMQKEARDTERELANRIDTVVGGVRAELNQKIDNLAADIKADLTNTEARLMAGINGLTLSMTAVTNTAHAAKEATSVQAVRAEAMSPAQFMPALQTAAGWIGKGVCYAVVLLVAWMVGDKTGVLPGLIK